MYFIGEQLESESGRSQHVYQGQIGSDTWIELPSLIVPRKGHTCGKYKLDNGTQVVVVAGGKTGTKMASNVRLIEVFNLETQQWSLTEQSVPGHPELGLYGAQIVETSEDLYLLGGKDGYTSDTYNTHWADRAENSPILFRAHFMTGLRRDSFKRSIFLLNQYVNQKNLKLSTLHKHIEVFNEKRKVFENRL